MICAIVAVCDRLLWGEKMPVHVVCKSCDAEYNLKDEFAGQTLACPECNANIEVPELQGPEAMVEKALPVPGEGDAVFQRDKFLLRQKHLSLSQKYYVWDEEGKEILFVQRPAHLLKKLGAVFVAMLVAGLVFPVTVASGIFAPGELRVLVTLFCVAVSVILAILVFIRMVPKRHITFYSDNSMADAVLQILQDKKVVFLNATYTVNDGDGACLGTFRKNYLFNLFRKRWYGYRADGSELLVAKEDSLILALLRRVLGSFWGLLRANYVILKPTSEEVIGEFNRKFTLLDRYVLDMSQDRENYVDRRMAIALGILLDTGERR